MCTGHRLERCDQTPQDPEWADGEHRLADGERSGPLGDRKDFTLDKAQRRLFPFVERSFEPETSDGFAIPGAQTKIRENIRYLFRRVLDEEHRLDSAEVERAYALFHDTWTEGKALLAADEAPQALHYYCRAERDHFTWDALPAERRITYDRNYVVRAWMSVLTYMLADYRSCTNKEAPHGSS